MESRSINNLNPCENHTGLISNTMLQEARIIRLLASYLIFGLLSMFFPGTLLGVWNLIDITTAQSPNAAYLSWVHAHGHAQLFGWVGTFILGIGFYTLPSMRKPRSGTYTMSWLCLFLWSSAICLRLFTILTLWQWTLLLPLSSIFQFSAASIFLFASMIGHKKNSTIELFQKPQAWAISVIIGSTGLLLTTIVNLLSCFQLSMIGQTPFMAADLSRATLNLSIWGFVLPIAWGLSTRWLPALLGLLKPSGTLLISGLGLAYLGILLCFFNEFLISSCAQLLSSIAVINSLHIFKKSTGTQKTVGTHPSYTLFVHCAYCWLLLSAVLNVIAEIFPQLSGIPGASRHAITVGFMATLIFSVGSKMLPNFLGKSSIKSKSLVLYSLALLTTGCFLRVSGQIIAYGGNSNISWCVLATSAFIELLSVLIFFINIIGTIFSKTQTQSTQLQNSN